MVMPESTLAHTLGRPISGDPPVIEIKPKIPGVESISVPLDHTYMKIRLFAQTLTIFYQSWQL
jgi:hypothetical protein